LDRCDSLCQLAGQYEFPVAAGIATANQLGWIVSGYLPSLDGRYASPYFWQTARDNV
uniref:Deoxyhypusine synthase n=1 Tax=Echinostoma caproni TaxID=27848 RepID=A0A183BDX0_9TREM